MEGVNPVRREMVAPREDDESFGLPVQAGGFDSVGQGAGGYRSPPQFRGCMWQGDRHHLRLFDHREMRNARTMGLLDEELV